MVPCVCDTQNHWSVINCQNVHMWTMRSKEQICRVTEPYWITLLKRFTLQLRASGNCSRRADWPEWLETELTLKMKSKLNEKDEKEADRTECIGGTSSMRSSTSTICWTNLLNESFLSGYCWSITPKRTVAVQTLSNYHSNQHNALSGEICSKNTIFWFISAAILSNATFRPVSTNVI